FAFLPHAPANWNLMAQQRPRSAIAPYPDLATVPTAGPASVRWPARACPALRQASAARAAHRRVSTPVTSPPAAVHTHSPSPPKSAAAIAAAVQVHTSPDAQ